MIKSTAFITIILSLLLLSGCGQDVFYEESFKPEDGIWKYEDEASFEFDINDISVSYNMYLDITHSADYPFQNLYINIYSSFPDGDIISDQHSLELQESGGQWIGGCSSGACEVRFILKEGMRFSELGSYGIRLEQYTRTEALKGVIDLSLVIENTKA